MKYFLTSLFFSGALILSTSVAFAAPNNATNNPNIVANYSSGQHTVIENPTTIDYNHQGSDVVMQAGNSGNFQQWFSGTSSTEPQDGAHGDHSVWKDIGSGTSCSSGWTFVANPNSPPSGDSWGSYFPNGDNYCVHTNDSSN